MICTWQTPSLAWKQVLIRRFYRMRKQVVPISVVLSWQMGAFVTLSQASISWKSVLFIWTTRKGLPPFSSSFYWMPRCLSVRRELWPISSVPKTSWISWLSSEPCRRVMILSGLRFCEKPVMTSIGPIMPRQLISLGQSLPAWRLSTISAKLKISWA